MGACTHSAHTHAHLTLEPLTAWLQAGSPCDYHTFYAKGVKEGRRQGFGNDAYQEWAMQAVQCHPSKHYCEGGQLMKRTVQAFDINSVKSKKNPICDRQLVWYDSIVRITLGMSMLSNRPFVTGHCT